jgi:glutathione S-transferase
MRDKPHVVRLFESVIPSGNAYKVQLALAQLGALEGVRIEALDFMVDPPETRRPAFLAINPNGRIPVVELSDGTFLPESNAILYYLAEGTPLLANDPVVRARTLGWMFFEQYSHERFVAVLKFWTYWGGLHTKSPDEVAVWRAQGQKALEVMETLLRREPFFSGPSYGIADIALFAYTQSSEAIGYDLRALTALKTWLESVRAQPGYVPMRRDPTGKAPDPR